MTAATKAAWSHISRAEYYLLEITYEDHTVIKCKEDLKNSPEPETDKIHFEEEKEWQNYRTVWVGRDRKDYLVPIPQP